MLLKNNLSFATKIFVLCLIFTGNILHAQTKVWSEDMTASLAEVGWIEQANDGIIIAAGAKGLMGIDNNTGKEVWMNKELKAVVKESYQNIEGLPLFYAEYSPIVGKTRGIIIHSSTGNVLYDTKDDNYRIKTYHLLPDQAMILFEMTKENNQLLMSFSLRTMTKTWVTDLGVIKGLISKIGNSAVRASFVDQGPMFTKSGDLIVGVNEMAYGIDAATGKIKWKYEADKKLQALVYSPQSNSVFMGVKKSNKLIVLDPANGADITPGKLKLKGSLLDITSDSKNNIVLVETEGFNLIDPKTSDFIWNKSYKIEYLDEVIPFEKGYIAVAKDEKDGSIAYVDANGKEIWDTKVKGYTYYATTTPKGVLYISTERSNIISYSDGKDVWDKDVKFKSIPAVTYDEAEKKVILFESGTGYKFDLATGAMTVFAEDIKLENVTKKTPLQAEYRPSGYVLYTNQHLSLLDKKGKLVHTKDYPQLTSTDFTSLAQFGAAVAGVDIDIAGSLENMKQLDRLSKGAYRETNAASEGTSKTWVFASATIGETPLFEVTKTRYTNSRNARNHRFILTKDGETKRAIMMVNKDTGKVDKKIDVVDITPQYIVDEIDTRVFIAEKNKTITCYDMK
ncbi:MAG TPA: PQQ-binding-like beta-propeller repeat protein [Saprospiraceae bacterium]|nr:PQQ-binding-like beta-propeller repeat protein [Saprospiraceae bacterium]